MFSKTTKWMMPCVLLVIAGTGCANKQKSRVVLLEEANRSLTDQINMCQGDLETAYNEQREVNRQLASSMRESDNLRGELAVVSRAPRIVERPIVRPPVVAPGWTAVPGGAMIALEGEILFPPGKAVIRDQARRSLDAVVSAIRGQYSDKHIFVFGHTDDTPIKKSGWKDNWELSAQRALEVVRYLTKNGVSPTRAVAGGCAEYRPRVPNSGKDNRKKNRRVEIFAMDKSLLAGA